MPNITSHNTHAYTNRHPFKRTPLYNILACNCQIYRSMRMSHTRANCHVLEYNTITLGLHKTYSELICLILIK